METNAPTPNVTASLVLRRMEAPLLLRAVVHRDLDAAVSDAWVGTQIQAGVEISIGSLASSFKRWNQAVGRGRRVPNDDYFAIGSLPQIPRVDGGRSRKVLIIRPAGKHSAGNASGYVAPGDRYDVAGSTLARADPLRGAQADGFDDKFLAGLFRGMLLPEVPRLRLGSRRLGDADDVRRI